MGFLAYHIRTVEEGRIALRRIGPLAIGGATGVFSKHLPSIAAKGEKWSLSAPSLLKLAGIDADVAQAVMFEISPRSARLELYELIEVTGRTVSMITDALFHFKVACSGLRSEYLSGVDGEIVVPAWRERPDRYEQMRLEGGVKGGTWAWSEPPQAMSATIL